MLSKLTDGAEAISKVQSEKLDILILDIMMPVIWIVTVWRFASKYAKCLIYLLLLTAKDEDDDRILGLRSGGWL